MIKKQNFNRTRLFTIITLALLACGFSACSSTASGGALGEDGLGLSDEDLALNARQRWGDGNIPQAQAGGPFQDVHFDYDSANISDEDQQRLRQDSQVLIDDASLHAEIEGHCDKRGTNEYNLALGEERALKVAKFLTNLGVRSSQLSRISYGEEIPLDPSDSEAAYAKNRRVHFALYRVDGKNKR